MAMSSEAGKSTEERYTRTVALEGADVEDVVPFVKEWHASHRTDGTYVGIRVVAPQDQKAHCTVAIDFASRRAADAFQEATGRWLEGLQKVTGAVPSIVLYRRVYTSREDSL
jgi:hypothetical protein